MRLAGEQQHYGPIGILEQPGETRAIAQQQRRALVGGKPARKADGEDVGLGGVEKTGDVPQLRHARALARVFAAHAIAHRFEHPRLHRLAGGPEVLIGGLVQPFPERGVVQTLAPLGPELAVEELRPELVQESGQVHAIGHEANGVLLGADLGPAVGAQPLRDSAVDAAHAVDVSRAVQREERHVEVTRCRRGVTEIEKPLDRHAELVDEVVEVIEDQAMPEGVMPGGDRGVRGEHASGRGGLQRGIERQAPCHVLAQQLQNEKGCMALVEVPDGRGQAEDSQRAHPADTEDHLLADAGRFVAAVQPPGDIAVRRRILGRVGVEQVDGDSAGLGLPDAGHHVAAGDAHADLDPLAGGAVHGIDGQVARVVRPILGLLHPIVVHGLGEVALLVEQAHRDEAGAGIARGLAVIARQNAEPPGVDREALVKAVLGAEIGRQRFVAVFRLRGEVGIERLQRLMVAREKERILGGAIERCLREDAQHEPWIAAALVPELRVKVLEQGADGPVPAEKEIAGEFTQARERFRGDGDDLEQGGSHEAGRGYRVDRGQSGSLAAPQGRRPDQSGELAVKLCGHPDASGKRGPPCQGFPSRDALSRPFGPSRCS